MVPPANLDGLSYTELKNLVVTLFEQLAEQQRTVAAMRDEIARLKGGPRRPNLKPSGMEKATEPKRGNQAAEVRQNPRRLGQTGTGEDHIGQGWNVTAAGTPSLAPDSVLAQRSSLTSFTSIPSLRCPFRTSVMTVPLDRAQADLC
jgi:hypothetical protein